MYGIEELIALAAEKRASDVHLIAGLPPKCRIDGRIETLTDGGLTREDCEEYGRQLAGNAADQIEAIGQLDFSASFAGRRLRVNLFRQQGALSAAIRLLGSTIPNLSELGLPEAVNQFSSWNKGIILVTGETGSGKSTTLAAILNEINQNGRWASAAPQARWARSSTKSSRWVPVWTRSPTSGSFCISTSCLSPSLIWKLCRATGWSWKKRWG